MSINEDIGERLREAACVGDVSLVKKLQFQGVDINSQNAMNGWTALHWASKRNHVAVVKLLLENGAKPDVSNKDGQVAAQLSSNEDIRQMLGAPKDLGVVNSPLAITPNYLVNPPFPYGNESASPGEKHAGSTQYQRMASGDSSYHQAMQNNNELVLKARLANSDDRDFIEIELDRQQLNFTSLLNLMCAELGVEKSLVAKVRKLPDTIVRKDKDVGRLRDFQEMELVLTNKAVSASSRNYNMNSLGAVRGTETIFY